MSGLTKVALGSALLAGALNAGLAQAQDSQSSPIEEIVVTAQRREASLQDVPIAVTALSSEQLSDRGIQDFSSYLATVPGAGVQETTGIGGEIKFRGIGAGINAQMSPTTAVYFGDVPVIHTGRNVNSSYNFWLTDMARIEVLRGPQGQLYGANSLGGAIKNVPNAAELGEFTGRFEASGAQIEDGGEDYAVSGMLNFPMGETLALRAVGYRVQQGGWYDNVFRGGPRLGSLPPPPPGFPPFAPGGALPLILAAQPAAVNYAAPTPDDLTDTNTTQIEGGRLMLGWTPSNELRVSLMAAIEEKDYRGAAFAEYSNPLTFPPFVPLPPDDYRKYQHNEGTTAGGGDEMELISLNIDYDFGGATFTSVTSWWERDEQLDLSLSISAFPITGQPDSVPVTNYRSDNPTVLTQEFRLTSTGEERIDWLAGVFYQEIDQDHSILAVDESGLDLAWYRQVVLAGLVGAPPPATRVVADNRSNFVDEQIALFVELGFDFTERWHAAASFRWFTLDQSFEQISSGFQFGVAQGFQSGENDDDVFTPRLELSYQPSDDHLFYASASEGYRTGIINRALPEVICGLELANAGYPGGLPPTKADTVLSYELGAKLQLADGRVQLNAAAYHSDWNDMQLNVPLSAFSPLPPGFSQCNYDGVINAGDAQTQGVELELTAALTNSLRVDVSGSYVDAQFEETIPQLNIAAGDSLPMQPEYTGLVGLQWGFSRGFARAEWQYVGEKAPFPLDFPTSQYPNGAPFEIGGYDVLNLRIGFDLSDEVGLQVFADNVLDEFGVTSANTTGGLGYPFVTTIRPRTIGASLKVSF